MRIIYGPVPSWRLGRSLGIDLLSTRKKTCSFDCVYCQLGKGGTGTVERREFVPISKLEPELQTVRGMAANYATFSGMGEPTLATNLGEAIEMARSILHLPVAVLTNSSLMLREDVHRELSRADVVIAKIDAPNEVLFRSINRPWIKYSLDDILQGIRDFRFGFRGKLALQMMFIKANKSYAMQMAEVANRLSPDELQINTPLRPCMVKPLSRQELAELRTAFSAFSNVMSVYDVPRCEIIPMNPEETRRRRPEKRGNQWKSG